MKTHIALYSDVYGPKGVVTYLPEDLADAYEAGLASDLIETCPSIFVFFVTEYEVGDRVRIIGASDPYLFGEVRSVSSEGSVSVRIGGKLMPDGTEGFHPLKGRRLAFSPESLSPREPLEDTETLEDTREREAVTTAVYQFSGIYRLSEIVAEILDVEEGEKTFHVAQDLVVLLTSLGGVK